MENKIIFKKKKKITEKKLILAKLFNLLIKWPLWPNFTLFHLSLFLKIV